jgi:hypothetical protein
MELLQIGYDRESNTAFLKTDSFSHRGRQLMLGRSSQFLLTGSRNADTRARLRSVALTLDESGIRAHAHSANGLTRATY